MFRTIVINALISAPLAIGAGYLAANYAVRSDRTDEKIEAWLAANPDRVYEAVTKYVADQNTPKAENFDKQRDKLFAVDRPHIGAPIERADILIAEFFDFNCVHCRVMEPRLVALLARRTDISLVAHDLAILGPGSVAAAKLARAAHGQGKYPAFRAAIMDPNAGNFDEAALRKLSEELQLDYSQLQADAQSQALAASIDADVAFGKSLNVTGTPVFYVWSRKSNRSLVIAGEITDSDLDSKLKSLE